MKKKKYWQIYKIENMKNKSEHKKYYKRKVAEKRGSIVER